MHGFPAARGVYFQGNIPDCRHRLRALALSGLPMFMIIVMMPMSENR
ncbi:hypothetical protein CPter291_5199 [Collimonas pratensis]|uniref:Uncharacterized protein n=1 Tax=Collimonas pratensis TaxID=279113 RepID=A0ABN4MLH0_9BURK|nr:hypothetical protein CPter291_5199 [Collimonas pratensis]